MKIREFSELTGLSAHTLRYYEKIGLLEVERDASGHRDYSRRNIKWARYIKRLADADMPLKEIKKFASLRHHCCGPECERLKVLEEHRARLEEMHKDILQQIEMMDEKISIFKVWNKMKKTFQDS